ncbi:uncharacterized protein LOC131892139 isoform X3 [Tigriopus californicus]|uniref:uncharacterized protein LOC131892139 isoform X3 n=1 Tax=Tigriopus californicus TaxID=6832 RepID=UPI0027DA588E|nr:uncharacterized protein LOC131892139 isoform X3 [Tigriopus californicus]
MSGKSKLVLDMLQHRDEVFRGSFSRAIHCGPSAHDFEFTSLLVQAFPSIERHDRVVRPEDLDPYAEKSSQKLLILDDFGNDAMERKEFKALFEMGSHHYNISVIVCKISIQQRDITPQFSATCLISSFLTIEALDQS